MTDITTLCSRVLCIHKGELFYDGGLETLTNKLAPSRELRVEVKNDINTDDFIEFGEVKEHRGRNVRLLVPRNALTKTIGKLLIDFDVVDLEVKDLPIDELIGKLFKNGSIE